MNKVGVKKLLLLFSGLFLLLNLSANYAFASFSNPVEIQGRHIVENDETLKSGRHVFVLTAENNSPMPKGSNAGVKKVTISSNESFSFGEITYDAPGEYKYTVSRELADSKNLKQDDSVYKCTVEVTNDGLAVVIFEKIGTQGKPNSILYTDKYITPSSKGGKVKTGDETDLLTLTVTVLSILFIVFAIYSDKIAKAIKNKLISTR